jgi:excisionase family DNA binding protein
MYDDKDIHTQLDTAISLAAFLNVSVAYVRKLTRTHAISFIKIGRAVRFERERVLAELKQKQQ